jgi:hypothetical protein
MLTFYCDHHIPGAITSALQQRGIDVLTAWDDGRARLPDEPLLSRATELNRILITWDKGFHRLAKRWRISGREFAGIVFGIQERIDVAETIEYLQIFAHVMSADEMRNRIEYLPTVRRRR